MPIISENSLPIYYEAYGAGETVVYLQSPLGGINPGAYYFAGRLSAHFRVLIWDSPNTGRSGVSLRKTPSEWHLCCQYLKELLDALGESAVHLAGCSGGGEMGLLFAHLYPDCVRSLAMYRPTDSASSAEQELFRARYFRLAEIVRTSSVSEAVEYSKSPPPSRFSGVSRWLWEIYEKDRDALLAFQGGDLAELLEGWGKWASEPLFYRANLSDAELSAITVPTLLCPCADEYHPERLSADLNEHLPNATLIPSARVRSEAEIYNALEEHPFGGFTNFVNEYEKFHLS